MPRSNRKLAVRLIGSMLILGACNASAAESPAPAIQSRYAVHGVRFERTAALDSADGRFRLDPRLESEPVSTKQAGNLGLRAKLLDGSVATCSATDAVFANGFE
jgi:hypothetical protein